MKTCSGCGVEKSRDEFCRDAQKSDGLSSRCRPCRAIVCARYAASDAGKASLKRRRRRYAETHAEKLQQWGKAWREAHPGYSADANRRWREANPGADAAYHQANRERTMERVLRRRNKLKDATVGPIDLDALWDEQGGACGICGQQIDRTRKHPDPLSASVDHIFPLSRGGSHTQGNLQWAHLTCNIRKGAKEPAHPLAG